VALLLRQGGSNNGRVANGVVRRAADAITNLAHENAHIKTRVRWVLRDARPSADAAIGVLL
jgi:hypothetical protein